MPYTLSVDQQALQALGKAMKAEADGKALRRELAKNLRAAADPAIAAAKSNLMAVDVLGGPVPISSPPLRPFIAKQMKAQARLSGRSTGARVRVRRRGPRDFDLAARRLNRAKGWRHPLFGDTHHWVRSVASPPGWFDRAMKSNRRQYKKAVLKAMDDMSKRLAERAREGR